MSDLFGNGHENENLLPSLLDSIWHDIVLSRSAIIPGKSCFALHEEYARSGATTSDCVRNLIDWQTAGAGLVGFALGLPGLAFAGVTIPSDIATTMFIQMRMVAVISLLHGWDPTSDQVKQVARLCLLGGALSETMRGVGSAVAPKLARNAVAAIPGRFLIRINQAVGFRLLTKFGSTGIVNLVKLVPVAGGIASGTINAVATRRIGWLANGCLAGGPQASA